jgi:prephenate dehydrogenase
VPGVPMIKKYLKRLIILNKEAILMEVLSIRGLMQLFMKSRNTDEQILIGTHPILGLFACHNST